MKLSDILPTRPHPSCVDGVFFDANLSSENHARILEKPNLLEDFLCDEDGNPMSFDISQDQRDLIIAGLRQQASDFAQSIKTLASLGDEAVSRIHSSVVQIARPKPSPAMIQMLAPPEIETSPLVAIERHLRDSNATAQRTFYVCVVAAACAALTLVATLVM